MTTNYYERPDRWTDIDIEYRKNNGLLSKSEVNQRIKTRLKSLKKIKITEHSICELCGINNKVLIYRDGQKHNSLQRHHTSYDKDDNGIFILCTKCHSWTHVIEMFLDNINEKFLFDNTFDFIYYLNEQNLFKYIERKCNVKKI